MSTFQRDMAALSGWYKQTVQGALSTLRPVKEMTAPIQIPQTWRQIEKNVAGNIDQFRSNYMALFAVFFVFWSLWNIKMGVWLALCTAAWGFIMNVKRNVSLTGKRLLTRRQKGLVIGLVGFLMLLFFGCFRPLLSIVLWSGVFIVIHAIIRYSGPGKVTVTDRSGNGGSSSVGGGMDGFLSLGGSKKRSGMDEVPFDTGNDIEGRYSGGGGSYTGGNNMNNNAGGLGTVPTTPTEAYPDQSAASSYAGYSGAQGGLSQRRVGGAAAYASVPGAMSAAAPLPSADSSKLPRPAF